LQKDKETKASKKGNRVLDGNKEKTRKGWRKEILVET
jgi:hypothetical protein